MLRVDVHYADLSTNFFDTATLKYSMFGHQRSVVLFQKLLTRANVDCVDYFARGTDDVTIMMYLFQGEEDNQGYSMSL